MMDPVLIFILSTCLNQGIKFLAGVK